MEETSSPALAATAAVLANDARASMLLLMLDGRAWTLTELSRGTGIARSSASEHADKLLDSGLAEEVRQGRHRYLRLAGTQAAALVESLASFSGRVRPAKQSLDAQHRDRAIREARTCYRHLAGKLGVALADGMRARGFLESDFSLAPPGRAWLESLGIDLPVHPRRPLTRPCLDWTERRDHVAGLAAEMLLDTLKHRAWIESLPSSTRAVRLTSAGEENLASILQQDLPRHAPIPRSAPA
ncbi:ArsR family transcriptional regulator [Leucobacter komagatae]|uniref:ArsR family transcriptional regulator n=1 Tax=Leucobacter komagatae TaxID=55969 RepID=A0A542Y6Y9_9MICO|nr:helix-turn-helix domain-containing protein [Leucobacter komagatae]TQL43869.1 ArsR family transcriptional regulator [Leucobacter komagatae]